jgi:hypothetical protein
MQRTSPVPSVTAPIAADSLRTVLKGSGIVSVSAARASSVCHRDFMRSRHRSLLRNDVKKCLDPLACIAHRLCTVPRHSEDCGSVDIVLGRTSVISIEFGNSKLLLGNTSAMSDVLMVNTVG